MTTALKMGQIQMSTQQMLDRESNGTSNKNGGTEINKPHKVALFYYAKYCADRTNQWGIVHNGKHYHTPVFPVVSG